MGSALGHAKLTGMVHGMFGWRSPVQEYAPTVKAPDCAPANVTVIALVVAHAVKVVFQELGPSESTAPVPVPVVGPYVAVPPGVEVALIVTESEPGGAVGVNVTLNAHVVVTGALQLPSDEIVNCGLFVVMLGVPACCVPELVSVNWNDDELPRATLPNPPKPAGACIASTAGVNEIPLSGLEGVPPGLAFSWSEAVSVPVEPAGGVN